MSALDVCVRNPITHHTWDNGRYITYEIAITTSNCAFCLRNSFIRRRYSEFEWLRKRLRRHHPLLTPAPLPPKKIFMDRFNADLVAFRMKGLEDFLIRLLEIKLFMSDTILHLFMQSDLTCKEMDEVMDGKVGADVIDHLWQNGGLKGNCRDFKKNAVTESESVTEPPDTTSEDQNSLSGSSTDNSSVTEEELANFPPIAMVNENGRETTSPSASGHVTSGASSAEESPRIHVGSGRKHSQNKGDARVTVTTQVIVETQHQNKNGGQCNSRGLIKNGGNTIDGDSDSDIEILCNSHAFDTEDGSEMKREHIHEGTKDGVHISPRPGSSPKHSGVKFPMEFSINGDIDDE